MKQYNYNVADCRFSVCGGRLTDAIQSLYGFRPFETQENGEAVFRFACSDEPAPEAVQLLYTGDTDGVLFRFYTHARRGHLLQMTHTSGDALSLWSEAESRLLNLHGTLSPQMLRFALWLGYGLMTLPAKRVAIHSSCIVNNGKAYLFLGESGTGKSTHTRLWQTHISGSLLLNDDSPIVRADEQGVWVYGSPWSGKTPCYKPERYPLCGCVRLSQAPFNAMVKLSRLQAYAALHPSCPPEFAYDNRLYDALSETLSHLLLQVPCYHLKCLPDADAARLSFKTLSAL